MLTFMPLPEIDRLAVAMQQPGYVPNTAQVSVCMRVRVDMRVLVWVWVCGWVWVGVCVWE
jgi:hypothetical protein